MARNVIPAEAVEAGIRTMPEYTPEDEADSFDRETNDMCRAKVERILEAAAPHINAPVVTDAAVVAAYALLPDEALRSVNKATLRKMLEAAIGADK